MIESVASSGTELQTGSMSPGASRGFEFFEKIYEGYGREASRIAKTVLHADYSPSGKMPVTIDNGFGGVNTTKLVDMDLEASIAKAKLCFLQENWDRK